MAGQERRDDRARRAAQRSLISLGAEIRQARLALDLSQAVAAAAVGKSASSWSRLERGAVQMLPLIDLMRAAAVVGLAVNARAFPTGSSLRDRAHLELLERLRIHLASEVGWATEVPLPNPGDQRARDALIHVAGRASESRRKRVSGMHRRCSAS